MLVLITGMSGSGKSTCIHELRTRGYQAADADDDGYCDVTPDGRWHWNAAKVRQLFDARSSELLFFSGCSEEQVQFRYDLVVLLSAREETLMRRLRTRTTNPFGRSPAERELVLNDLRTVEPLLRRSADVEIDTSEVSVSTAVDRILQATQQRAQH